MTKGKPKISVITPTIRVEGLKVVHESLLKQTFKSWEWLVEIGDGVEMSFSKDMNKMLRRAKGELIVSLQDYIKAPKDGLEIFWEEHQEHIRTFFTAPVGKTTDWVSIRFDWRKNGERRKIEAVEWELDWAAAPLQAFYDIGGFDENFDRGWSWDNVNLALRAQKAEYGFIVLPNNEAVAYDHDAVMEHPFRDKLANNDVLSEIKRDDIEKGNWKLDYLTRP